MTLTDKSPSPSLPDFQKDAEVIAAYAEARASYLRQEAIAAEQRERGAFEKRRKTIRLEIESAGYFLEERMTVAEKALWEYALRYPLRVKGDQPMKPSFWEFLWSFGFARCLYNLAVVTAAAVKQAQSRRRRLEESEEELERQFQRSLYLQQEAKKKSLELPAGLAAFHTRLGVADLRARVDEIAAERAQFAARLAAGEVSHTERRDREFAEFGIVPLEVPCNCVTIVRVARYDSLTYVILRNLERKLFALPYDPRLEALIEHVVDVYWHVDCFEVRAALAPNGRPMTVAEHYAANFKDAEDWRTEHRAARVALGLPRTDIPPMTLRRSLNARIDEADLIELLASYAESFRPLEPAVAAVPVIAADEPAPSPKNSSIENHPARRSGRVVARLL